MSQTMGISPPTVGRIWRSHGLKPLANPFAAHVGNRTHLAAGQMTIAIEGDDFLLRKP